MAGATKAPQGRTVSLWELVQGLLSSRLALPAILLLTFAVFAPSLNDWFRSDDFWWLRASQDTPFGEYVRGSFDYRDPAPVPEFIFYRPFYMITFRLCYEAFGENAAAYHALNVALHLAAVTLVWLIARRLVQSVVAANVMTLIFALHPAYTETVTWISRGNTLMLTVAYLTTILLFLKYLDGGRRAALYYWGAVLAFVAAFLYHPNALSLVPLLPAYVFLVAQRPHSVLRPRAWLPFVPFVVLGVGWALIQNYVRGEYGLDETFKVGFHQYSNFAQYLGYMLFPVLPTDWLDFGFSDDDLRVGLLLVASVGVIGIGLGLLARRTWPYVGVVAVLWLITSLFFNTTIVITRAVPAQLYMPGLNVAFFFVLAWFWGDRLLQEAAPQARMVASKVAPWVLVLLLAVAIGLDLNHLSTDQEAGAENERFFAALKRDVPELAPGAQLYVTGVPFNLHVFNDDAFDASVELYYGEVDAHSVRLEDAAAIEEQLGPDDVLYRYQRR